MTRLEFNKISKKVCASVMYEDVEMVYMAFSAITKQQMSIMYWGDKPLAYGLWNKALTLAKELRAGFENDYQLDTFIIRKIKLIKDIQNTCN